MSKGYFEDMPVEIYEDKTINDTTYDIQNGMLISTKNLSSVIQSSIYNYPDGYSLYLKFDESGMQKMVFPMLAIYSVQDEKKLGSFPDSAEFTIKRYNDNYFIMTMKDDLNKQGNITFATVKPDGKVVNNCLNFTELINYEFIDERYFIITTVENLNDKYSIWVSGVYDFSGKGIKVLVDKKFSKDISFNAYRVVDNKGKVHYQVDKTEKGVTKKFKKVYLGYKVPVEKVPEDNKKETPKLSFLDRLKKKRSEKNKEIEAKKTKDEKPDKASTPKETSEPKTTQKKSGGNKSNLAKKTSSTSKPSTKTTSQTKVKKETSVNDEKPKAEEIVQDNQIVKEKLEKETKTKKSALSDAVNKLNKVKEDVTKILEKSSSEEKVEELPEVEEKKEGNE